MSKAARKSGLSSAVTAYHEAGHAVISWCLDVAVTRATNLPDERAGSAGHVLNRRMGRNTVADIEWADRFTPGRLQAEKRAMVSMAGELAQRRFNPGSVRSYHASSDRENIVKSLERYARPTSDGVQDIDITQHYKLLRQWTIELLDDNWSLVEAVAEEIIKHRTLSGKEVRAVIMAANDKKFGLKALVVEKQQRGLQRRFDGQRPPSRNDQSS
jgi:ATP-dependent Zn protease